MSIRYALNLDSTPHYMSNIGMRHARFLEDGDKPGTGVSVDGANVPDDEPDGSEADADETEAPEDLDGLKRALARERDAAKAARRELGAAKSALQQIEDDKLDDLGKATKRAEEAEARAAAAEAKVAVRELADEHGITDSKLIAALAAIPDEEARRNVAVTFKDAGTKTNEEPQRRYIPKAGSGSNSTGGSGGTLQAGRERFAASRNKN